MPTFKNNTQRYIDCGPILRQEPNGKPIEIWVRFSPGEQKELEFWLPYQQKGLTLVSESYPPVPNTILLSGQFNFNAGTERKYNIEPCDTYAVNVIVQKGSVKMYTGNSSVGVLVAENADVPYHYRAVLDWEYAPYLKLVGQEAGTVVTLHAEVDRDYLVNAKAGVKVWR